MEGQHLVATPHNFVVEKLCNSDELAKFYHIVFCTRCGYVAWFGNSNNDDRQKQQSCLPKTCIGGPLDVSTGVT
jgi:hypothetical protein